VVRINKSAYTMQMKKILSFLIVVAAISSCTTSRYNETFNLNPTNSSLTFYLDNSSDSLVLWAVNDLADDIMSITGKRPEIIYSDTIAGPGIYVSMSGGNLITAFKNSGIDSLEGKWEHFHLDILDDKVIIAGSDIRGTVYGIFDVAERIGISPWKWWADVTPLPASSLQLELPQQGVSEGPSVKYRGIFINDEDWGMQPWAAKTFEPETGDIGPKTYEKIFQLLLRLKANTIWPAMHPCTRAFYQVPGNNEMAGKYHIVVGTSHCEPILRNNVDEWDKDAYGDYNFFTNSGSVCNYWQERIDQVSGLENIITLGMRGVHDGRMEGGGSMQEQVAKTEEIMGVQRSMLSGSKEIPLESIPQTIVLYKEVLDLYNLGMDVPEDVTLMWCDDNYGYIRRLSDEAEQQRSGGSGVYYHLSYWGRPHDYLWLSTTQPALIWFEMSRAWQNGARQMWIANVGDLKPAEYNIEFFLDLAWDINAVDEQNINDHLTKWASREFGEKNADDVAEIMEKYYRLAFLRKPEYMGWSQTEPTTEVRISEFNINEARNRISMYRSLIESIDKLESKIPNDRKSAWFELVEYPVKGAALMNEKFLYAQLSAEAANQVEKFKYADKTKDAYSKIDSLTAYYNNILEGGKWRHIMSMNPRGLPVFNLPVIILEETDAIPSSIGDKQFIPIQAAGSEARKGAEGYKWESVQGLGYSGSSVTLLPLLNHTFDSDSMPWIEYIFDADQAGPFTLQVRCLPTHSNDFNQQLTIQIDDQEPATFSLNTKGRSADWKRNVLRNSQIIRMDSEIKEAGKHSIKIMVNQTGIVLDQLAVDFNMSGKSYEIPACW